MFGDNITLCQKKGSSAPSQSPTLLTTAHKTKIDSFERSSVSALKRDHRATPPHAETPIPVISRKSFTKLPQWDFEDYYNLDAPPRLTVSMLKQDMAEMAHMFVGLWVWEGAAARGQVSHVFTCVFVFVHISSHDCIYHKHLHASASY